MNMYVFNQLKLDIKIFLIISIFLRIYPTFRKCVREYLEDIKTYKMGEIYQGYMMCVCKRKKN